MASSLSRKGFGDAGAIALMLVFIAVAGVGGEDAAASGAVKTTKPRPFGPRVGAWVGRRNLALGRKCTSSSLDSGSSVKALTDGQRFGVFEVRGRRGTSCVSMRRKLSGRGVGVTWKGRKNPHSFHFILYIFFSLRSSPTTMTIAMTMCIAG